MITRETDYAIRIVQFLASPEMLKDGTTAMAINAELGIPCAILRNILRRLAVAGIVISTRGRTGGVVLAEKALKLTVLDILNAIDCWKEKNMPGKWVCNAKKGAPDPVQELFAKIQSKVNDILDHVTLNQLV